MGVCIFAKRVVLELGSSTNFVYSLKAGMTKHVIPAFLLYLRLLSFAVRRRRNPGIFSENPAEIKGIVIAYDRGDFANTVITVPKKPAGIGQTYGSDIPCGAHSRILSETSNKPAYTHMKRAGILSNINFSAEIPMKIVYCFFHLALKTIV